MDDLIKILAKDFPSLSFVPGKSSRWSPKTQEITYKVTPSKHTRWATFHELGHALLGHSSYTSDFELLRLEVAAWQSAKELAIKYGDRINDLHIQNCLDTYRDWLHRRSTCPICGVRSLQQNKSTYHCFNCQSEWRVSTSRFCRAYRQLERANQKSPTSPQAIFS
jgi:formate dehydrogenase assembly factor FdhD